MSHLSHLGPSKVPLKDPSTAHIGSRPDWRALVKNWSMKAPVFLYLKHFLEVRTEQKSALPGMRIFSSVKWDLRLQSGTFSTLGRGSNLITENLSFNQNEYLSVLK